MDSACFFKISQVLIILHFKFRDFLRKEKDYFEKIIISNTIL